MVPRPIPTQAIVQRYERCFPFNLSKVLITDTPQHKSWIWVNLSDVWCYVL